MNKPTQTIKTGCAVRFSSHWLAHKERNADNWLHGTTQFVHSGDVGEVIATTAQRGTTEARALVQIGGAYTWADFSMLEPVQPALDPANLAPAVVAALANLGR